MAGEGRRLISGQRIGVAALILALSGALGLVVMARQAKKIADPILTRKSNRPMPVRTEFVSQTSIEKMIGGTAVTIPSLQATIRIRAGRGIQSPGGFTAPSVMTVRTARFKLGDAVKKGDLLFEIDDDEFQLALKQAEENLANAERNLKLAREMITVRAKFREKEKTANEADVEAAAATLDSRKRLFDAAEKIYLKQANTEVDYYDARADYQVSVSAKIAVDHKLEHSIQDLITGLLQDQSDLAQAESQRNAADIAARIARRNVELCHIESPLDGYVSNISAVSGEVVESTTVLAQVDTLDPIHLRMDYPQERIDELVFGQEAEIVLDSLPKEVFTGRVLKISSNVDTDSRVLPVIIEMQNPRSRIKSGIAGFARIRLRSDGLKVPATAVVQQGNRAIVFRVDQTRASIVPVETGHLVEPGVLELRGGVNPGDEIVIFGNKDLKDNDKVNTDWKKWMLRE